MLWRRILGILGLLAMGYILLKFLESQPPWVSNLCAGIMIFNLIVFILLKKK
jgi:hypothetical protein